MDHVSHTAPAQGCGHDQLFLEQAATEQWHADIVGGIVADKQRTDTELRLASIGLTRCDVKYRTTYERVRSRI